MSELGEVVESIESEILRLRSREKDLESAMGLWRQKCRAALADLDQSRAEIDALRARCAKLEAIVGDLRCFARPIVGGVYIAANSWNATIKRLEALNQKDLV